MMDILRISYEVTRLEKVSVNRDKIRETDVIVLNWAEAYLDAELKRRILLYKLSGIKIIWVFHNKVPHDNDDSFAKKKMRWLAAISDIIICHSHNSTVYLRNKSFIKKAVYIPHPAYMGKYDRFAPYKSQTFDETLRVGMFGLIRPYKNIDILIEIFSSDAYKDTELYIAGMADSRYKAYTKGLTEWAKDYGNIHIETQRLSDEDFYHYHMDVDIVVLPLDTSSSMNSGSLIKALSYGRPVIVSDIAMARDMADEPFIHMYHAEKTEHHIEGVKKQLEYVRRLGKKELHQEGEAAMEYMKKHNNTEEVLSALKQAIGKDNG